MTGAQHDNLPGWVDPELLDGEERVAADVRCVACKYNLRTLPVRQRCPECGQQVVRSLYRLELEYAPEEWARDLANGAGVLSAAGAMALLGLALQFLPGLPFAPISVVLAGVIAPIIAAIGLYTLTTPDPRPPRKPEGLSFRRAARWSLLVGVVLIGATLWQSLRGPSVLPSVALVLVTGTVLALLLAHTMLLLRRAHSSNLARLAKVLAISVASLAAAASTYILWMERRAAAPAAETHMLHVLAQAACLIVAAGFTFVFLRTERVLRDSAEQICPRMPPVE